MEGPKEKGGEMSEQGCWELEECRAERGWERRKDGDGRAEGEVNHSWRLLAWSCVSGDKSCPNLEKLIF